MHTNTNKKYTFTRTHLLLACSQTLNVGLIGEGVEKEARPMLHVQTVVCGHKGGMEVERTFFGDMLAWMQEQL